MTIKEFDNLTFLFRSHLAMANEHTMTYATEDNRFAFCVHTPFKDGEPKGRVYKHYMVDGKVYKTDEALIKAIENL